MKPVAVLKKKKFSGAENKKRKEEETAENAILSERLKRFCVVSTVGIHVDVFRLYYDYDNRDDSTDGHRRNNDWRGSDG